MSVEFIEDLSEPKVSYMVDLVPIPVQNRYKILPFIEEKIRSHGYKFGFGLFSDVVFMRTYSREINGKKESFPDVIIRNIEGIISILKNHKIINGLHWDDSEWDNFVTEFGIMMMDIKVLPPGRGIYVTGTEFGYNKGSVAYNNCAYISTIDGILHSATQCFDLLMNGCGVGYSTYFKDDNIITLPGCKKCRLNKESNCMCNKKLYKIFDSREGWDKSLFLLLESYHDNNVVVNFDYSGLRIKGAKINGFGGIASGSEPLAKLHLSIRNYFECYFESKDNVYDAIINLCNREILPDALLKIQNMDETLRNTKTYGTTRLVADIFNSIGVCVISGNVRRSSEIALGYADDLEFINLKNYELNPEREFIGWMSNNSVVMSKQDDFLKIPDIVERIKINAEPGIMNLINVQKYGRIGKKHPIGRETEPDLATGVNPCITGDTLILTQEGLIRADNLLDKQFIAIVNGNQYLSTIDGFWSSGIKSIVKITLENGMVIKVTSDHKILTELGWKTSTEFGLEEKIVLSNNTNYRNENSIKYVRETILPYLIKYSMNEIYRESYEKLINDQIILASLGIISKLVSNYNEESGINIGYYLELPKNISLYLDFKDELKQEYFSCISSIEQLGNEKVYDCTIPGPHCFSGNGVILSNCGEINLESGELCNLCEIFMSRCETYEDLEKAAKFATFYSSTISLLPGHWSNTNKIVSRNRRIGISLSGVADFYDKNGPTEMTKVLKSLYKVVREENKRLAKESGIPASLRVCTIKPSGTISLLAGCSSGMHWPEYTYAIRTIRIASNSDLVPILIESGIKCEDDYYSGSGTKVFSFPIYQGPTREACSISVWEQAWLQTTLQREWSDNGVSSTLKFNLETEGSILENVLAQMMPLVKGVSCLPIVNGGCYIQAPYQKSTKEEYDLLNSTIRSINWDTFSVISEKTEIPRGCDGDKCMMEFSSK